MGHATEEDEEEEEEEDIRYGDFRGRGRCAGSTCPGEGKCRINSDETAGVP